jgi:hypothetical protein
MSFSSPTSDVPEPHEDGLTREQRRRDIAGAHARRAPSTEASRLRLVPPPCTPEYSSDGHFVAGQYPVDADFLSAERLVAALALRPREDAVAVAIRGAEAHLILRRRRRPCRPQEGASADVAAECGGPRAGLLANRILDGSPVGAHR